jgi:HK97 family phage prohead protease
MEIERRIHSGVGIEIRKGNAGDVQTLRGYAAKFGVLSEPMWGFREKIASGAFDSVMEDDVRALFNHDPNHVLGRSNSGTLRLQQDEMGLQYEVDLPDTQAARDLMVSIKRGDVSQSSFAFTVAQDDWTESDDGLVTRTILAFKRLYDVSPVTYPAYPDATVGVRSLEAWKSAKSAEKEDFQAQIDAEFRAKSARSAASRRRYLAMNRA